MGQKFLYMVMAYLTYNNKHGATNQIWVMH